MKHYIHDIPIFISFFDWNLNALFQENTRGTSN
jgi:hypothetical protein